MLSSIRSVFGIKTNIEKEARAIWDYGAEGAFRSHWRTPILGESWNEAYYPYWAQWVLEPRVHAYESDYASITDRLFWKNISTLLTEPAMTRALMDTGARGNLAALKTFSSSSIQHYANHYKVPLNGPREFQLLVHPDTVAFMRERGYWDQRDVDAMVNDYFFVDDDAYTMASVSNCDRLKGAATPAFIEDWITKVLRDYRWASDAQAQFVGHCLMTNAAQFPVPRSSINMAPVLLPGPVPFLHPDVDMALLAAVCGLTVPESFGLIVDHPDVRDMYRTVKQVSDHCRQHVWTRGESSADACKVSVNGSHAGLNLLLDLTPVRQPMDLYRAALAVQQCELGLVNNESFPLPPLME